MCECVSVCVCVSVCEYERSDVVLMIEKGKRSCICIAPHCAKLASEALRYGSHSCYTANSPYPHLPRSIHQMAPPIICSDSSHLLIYRTQEDERLSWPS